LARGHFVGYTLHEGPRDPRALDRKVAERETSTLHLALLGGHGDGARLNALGYHLLPPSVASRSAISSAAWPPGSSGACR